MCSSVEDKSVTTPLNYSVLKSQVKLEVLTFKCEFLRRAEPSSYNYELVVVLVVGSMHRTVSDYSTASS